MQTTSKTLMPQVVTSMALIALLTMSASAHANPQLAKLQANFQASDLDKNEQLNAAEFKTFIDLNADHKLGRAVSIRRFGMYTQAFKATDANGDGVVTKEEIAAHAKH
jgi:Ca2+-binding EF-hand superfamily protein